MTTARKHRSAGLGTLFARGGVVQLPARTYFARLQKLHGAGNHRGHSNLLHPGLAHFAHLTRRGLVTAFVELLGHARSGAGLHGLESLYLTALQSLTAWRMDGVTVPGLVAWARHRPEPSDGPLLVFDRMTASLQILSNRALPALHELLDARSIFNRGVVAVLQAPDRNVSINPSILHVPGDIAADCKDKVAAWSALGGILVTIGTETGWALGQGRTDSNSVLQDTASILQISGALAAGVGLLISAYGCKDPGQGTASGGNDPNQNLDQALAHSPGAPVTDGEWNQLVDSISGPGSSSGSDTSPGGSGDPSGGGAQGGGVEGSKYAKDLVDWVLSPDPTPPPDPPGSAQGSTPTPDGDGGGHALPPGLHKPGTYTPNPDGTGPQGPTLLPNGALFIPSSAIARAAARHRGPSLIETRQVTFGSGALGTTIQLSGFTPAES